MQEYTDSEKKQLIEAIDHYSLFTPKYRSVLKTLINLAVKNVAIITIKELSELCNTSKPVVYRAFELLEEKEMIQIKKRERSRLSEFILKPKKLEEIIKFYQTHKNVKKNLTGNVKKT